MSHFDTAIKKVLKHEGGYVDHKNDPGGATKYGISLRFIRKSNTELDLDGDGDIDSDDYLAARDKAIKKAKGEANEEVTPEEEDKLKDIEGELKNASKMHKSQADRIKKIVKEMSDEEFQKAKEAERLENHPEKDKIKAIQAMMDKERKMKKSDLKEFIKSVLKEQ